MHTLPLVGFFFTKLTPYQACLGSGLLGGITPCLWYNPWKRTARPPFMDCGSGSLQTQVALAASGVSYNMRYSFHCIRLDTTSYYQILSSIYNTCMQTGYPPHVDRGIGEMVPDHPHQSEVGHKLGRLYFGFPHQR